MIEYKLFLILPGDNLQDIKMDERLIEAKNDINQLSFIVEKLEEYAMDWNLSPDTLFNINLAVEELFTNIVFYAYADKDEHLISIKLVKDSISLTIKFEDDGKEFDPTAYSEPDHIDKPLEEREVGGLGIHFVNKIMKSVEYKRLKGKNVLTLVYSLDG